MNDTDAAYPTRDDIEAVMGAVLATFVAADPAPSDRHLEGRDDLLTGCVTIGGAFSGALLLRCRREFARRIADRIFDEGAEEQTDAEIRDVCAELTNMMGGNIKSLFSVLRRSHCRLSIPVVAAGGIDVPNAHVLYDVTVQCGPDLVNVAVIEERA